MRRLPEGLRECPREVPRAEPHQLRQRDRRQGLGKVRLDLLVDRPPLPRRKAAASPLRRAGLLAVEPDQLGDKNGAQRFGVVPIGLCASLDFLRQLCSRGPQRRILEEQSGPQACFAKLQFRIHQRTLRVDVEVTDPGQNPRLLPTKKFAARRYEGQPAAEFAAGRARQPFDHRLAVAPFGAVRGDQQVIRRAQPVFERLEPRQLDHLGGDAAPGAELPPDNAFGRDGDAGMSLDHVTSTVATFPTLRRGP